MTVEVTSREERAARARAALAHAEQRTGARSIVRPAGVAVVPQPAASVVGALDVPPMGDVPPADAPDLRAAPEEREVVETVVRRTSLLMTERPSLPVPTELAALLPDGLRRGSTTAVTGSTSLLLTLLARACSEGAWAAVVGQPAVGLLAAAQAGVALERLAVVPRPGPDSPAVVAALLDGLDVVLVGPGAALTDGDRRRLAARARERGTALLSSVAWPGANVVLTAGAGRWDGVGQGEGRLRTHELRVTRSGRAGAGVPLSVDVTLPLGRPVGTEPPATPAPGRVPAPLRLVG